MSGGEGVVGGNYFRLYPVEKIVALNQAYGVDEFAKGLIIFGSNGGGEAFAFDTRNASVAIVQIPFIPMDFKYLRNYGGTLYECLRQLQSKSQQADKDLGPLPNPTALGKEIHEIQPIVFGGDPIDSQNKVLLSPEEYAPYVVWWNRKYREVKGEGGL